MQYQRKETGEEIVESSNGPKSGFYSDTLERRTKNSQPDVDRLLGELPDLGEVYTLYGYRHFELTLYCFTAMCNQITWISLQPVTGAIENAYGYGATAISALGITYMIVFLFVNYPSSYIIDKGGLRLAVCLGMGFTTLGMIVKCFVNKSFAFVIIGQVIAAIGQPLLAIAPAKLATFWYGPNERVIATTIATAAQPLGVAIGFVFPSIFVKAADSEPGEQNVENARHHIYQSQLWQAIVGIIVFLLILLLFREKPRTPPSASSNAGQNDKVWTDTKACLANPNTRKLIVTFGIIFGTVNTYGTIVGILSNRMGYSDSDASVVGAVFIFGGIVGSGIFGGYVESTRKYKKVVVMIACIAVIGPIALMGTLYTGLLWPLCTAALFLGFDLAILPVGIDFGVELTFPVDEPISTGLLMSTAQLFGIFLVVGCTAMIELLDKAGVLASQLLLIAMAVIGLIFAVAIKEDLQRLKFEQKAKDQNKVGVQSEQTSFLTSESIPQ